MPRLLRLLAIAGAALVVTVAAPGSAYALQSGTRTLFTNYSNGFCMGVAGGDSKVADGAAIITWWCDGTANQTWVITPVDASAPNGPFFIQDSVATTECLSVAAKGTTAGSRLVLWHCKPDNDNQDQRWEFTSDRQAPYVYLVNVNASPPGSPFMLASALNTGNGSATALEPQGPTWFPRDAWVSVCESAPVC